MENEVDLVKAVDGKTNPTDSFSFVIKTVFFVQLCYNQVNLPFWEECVDLDVNQRY